MGRIPIPAERSGLGDLWCRLRRYHAVNDYFTLTRDGFSFTCHTCGYEVELKL